MFCSKCGCKIVDNAKFCCQCGEKTNINVELSTQSSNINKEFDHEAIQIYLSNVLSMECAVLKLQNELSLVKQQIVDFNTINYTECIQHESIPCDWIWLNYNGKEYNIAFNYNWNKKWYSMVDYIEKLNTLSFWPGAPFDTPDLLLIETFCGLFIDPFYQRTQKKAFFEEYEKFKNKAPQCYEDAENQFKATFDKRDEIIKELTKAKELLNDAYNINIIPKQFRNIYAVWFVYDYLSTSNESLSSAFLQFNLDAIKQKLDIIIEQQQEIILNQKIQIAQNSQIMEQNQQKLKVLANIEQNTERAAQYARIAANNAEACAWIGVANYIT